MEFLDQIKAPSGRLILDVFENGYLIERFDEQNLIVGGMTAVLASLIGGGVGPVTKIGFGISGSPPDTGNTDLSGAFVKSVGVVEFPTPTQVKFNFTLDSAEGNGLAIMEFGLMTAANVLVARRVRAAPINKNIALSFTGAWIIQF
jgi:hypothetical protein